MRQNRLFELLQSLSPDERNRLHQFLHSPYFTRGKTAEHLRRGILYFNGQILPDSLHSFGSMALDAGRPDLLLQVLEEHRGKISGEPEGEPYYLHGLAQYRFGTGAPDKALEVLPPVLPDASHYFSVKLLEIQALYDTRSQLLPYRMDAFRMFLNRTGRRHPSRRLKHARFFLNFLAQIVRCAPGNIRRAQVIGKRIQDCPQTPAYYWLLEKVDEIGRSPEFPPER